MRRIKEFLIHQIPHYQEMSFRCRLRAWMDFKPKATCKLRGAPTLTCQGLESWCYKPSDKSGPFSQITVSDWIMKKWCIGRHNSKGEEQPRIALGMTRTLVNIATDTQLIRFALLYFFFIICVGRIINLVIYNNLFLLPAQLYISKFWDRKWFKYLWISKIWLSNQEYCGVNCRFEVSLNHHLQLLNLSRYQVVCFLISYVFSIYNR